MGKVVVALLASSSLCVASILLVQGAAHGAAAPKETEMGIPVTDPLVIEKCSGCHTRDDKGNLSRISWIRTTPEGWSQAIRRMVRQNGLQLGEQDARAVIRSLSSSHGLAPEEAKPVMYFPEKRIVEETLIPNDGVRAACSSCHAFGQAMSWRRSKNDWQMLQSLHVALYAQADQIYRRGEAGMTGADGKTPGEMALDYLAKNAPLHSPEWTAWRSRMSSPQLAGKWLVAANAMGKGRFVGEMTISPGPTKDDFKTTVVLRSLETGEVLRRSGSGVVYAGYSWRGRSSGSGGGAPDALGKEAREVLWIAPNQATAEGRWYWGGYDEFGFDVKLTRAGAGPKVVSVAPYALKVGTTSQVRILGDNFPAAIAASDVDLGAGLKVNRIVSRSPKELVIEVSVAPEASSGQRDVVVAGAVLENAFPVYRKIDYLKATPETAMARLGGHFPKGYQQFEAIGFENGADGKPKTADDVKIGPIDATWKVEEFIAVYGDDDRDFVGSLSPSALFTPAADGPNATRKFGRNNYGDVWVVATAKTEKDSTGKPLSARSYLVVTVPLYQRWDQPEVSQ